MDSKNLKWLSLGLAVAFLLLGVTGVIVQAQTGGGYDLSWWTVDGGGETVEGGDITLVGTVGQPDAGPALSGGGFSLAGGFWPRAGASQYKVYLPLVVRNYR